MTKEELFIKWRFFHLRYPQSRSGQVEDKKQFFEDLEAWYESRHIEELNARMEEVIKSFKEMDEAVKAAAKEEPKHRKGYDCYD